MALADAKHPSPPISVSVSVGPYRIVARSQGRPIGSRRAALLSPRRTDGRVGRRTLRVDLVRGVDTRCTAVLLNTMN